MIVSRTPFRISFFGGGTDYPGWYKVYGGSVLASSINKYCYISVRNLPHFFEHKYRIVYSKIENCQEIDDIQHPSVREIIRFLTIYQGLEIHHDGDLPARSGMGSSSSFTVGLLKALYALKGKMVNRKQLALESIHIEQEIIRETVGSQDQVSAAYGGFNHIIFHPNGEITVLPVILPAERIQELHSHLMLFYTGIKRTASDIADSFVTNIETKWHQLQLLQNLVDESLFILNSNQDISEFGKLLHEAWLVKRSLSSKISNPAVDTIYNAAHLAGSLGGKLTGAGGGGFLLLFAPPELHYKIQEKLYPLIHVPFQFDCTGSQIIFYDPDDESLDLHRYRNAQTIVPDQELHEAGKQI